MSAPTVSVPGLLALLEAVGARLALDVDGDGLALTGKRPPVPLLDTVKERRAELIAYLKGACPVAPPAKAEAVDCGPALPPRPDWPALSASPGHCGSCTRFELAPEWGAFMGTCGCPASGWPDNTAPLAIHSGHRCAAYRADGEAVGRGYRARASTRPVPLEDGRRQGVGL